jgi:hypothetical protein
MISAIRITLLADGIIVEEFFVKESEDEDSRRSGR